MSTISTPRSPQQRMIPVTQAAKQLRFLFEVEREFLRAASTLVYRVGIPELKYHICEHIWESAQHARFLRERGKEMTGFGSDEAVRPGIRLLFEEALRTNDGMISLLGFYRVLKPALLATYRAYLASAEPLADWPTTQLLKEFIRDEERHAAEIAPYLTDLKDEDWLEHLRAALPSAEWPVEVSTGGLPADFPWRGTDIPYTHSATCNRGIYPVCGTAFGDDPENDAIVGSWLKDPATDPKVIRIMVYVWLMNEMDAIDYLSTIVYDTPQAPFDLQYDLARHLWDESRHSQFGYRQLPRLGIDLKMVEQQVGLYDALVQLLPHERYALMTAHFEAGSFDLKALVMDRVRELGDFEADALLAFDRSDEQNHVRYGHRWLKTLLALFGEERPPEQFVRETVEKLIPLLERENERIGHGLPREKRLTGAKIRQFVESQAG
jgi:ferritin-like metal-binding protein YciE